MRKALLWRVSSRSKVEGDEGGLTVLGRGLIILTGRPPGFQQIQSKNETRQVHIPRVIDLLDEAKESMDMRAGAGYAANWTTEGTSGEKTVTEAEWLACTDPLLMLKSLRRKSSERKLRHFACACCRDIWHLLTVEHSRTAVEVAERFADGDATRDELEAVWKAASAVAGPPAWAAAWASEGAARKAARGAARGAVRVVEWQARVTAWEVEVAKAGQAATFREIFGNPFHPITLDPAWLTWHDGLIVSMARRMYDSRDFSDMPVLADALEEAGCTNQDILGHCRSAGEHVRGCWVIDSILGRS
ncbi:MAG TPA: hypothetical protein VH643_36090 [Gemmataceae bacterium]|jgi:hypothetical protein